MEKFDLPDHLKRNFFRATVDSFLVYGSITLTLTSKLKRKIDGAYTRMLRAALNKPWKDLLTNKELYGNIPPITTSIRQQRIRFAGHCWRSKEELAADLKLWMPSRVKRSLGRPRKTYIDQLVENSRCRAEDLATAVSDREEWRERVVIRSRASST